MNYKLISWILFAVLVIFGLGAFTGATYFKQKVKVIVTDTTYVPKPVNLDSLKATLDKEIVYKDVVVPVVPDYVQSQIDSLRDLLELYKVNLFISYRDNAKAKLDTTIDQGKLSVTYFFPPRNEFSILFEPFPIREETKSVTITEYKDKPFYLNKWFYATVALAYATTRRF